MTTRDQIFAQAGLPIPQRGVSYYNKDNKENKDNKDNEFPLLPLGKATPLETASQCQIEELLLDSKTIKEESREKELLDSESGSVSSETPRIGMVNPAILPEDVDRCLLTFYDNGEGKRQRYKLGITINPNSATNERWEFIANLNKDPRIFRRNIPEENRQLVYDFGTELRNQCKSAYRVYPMLGKIHDNSKLTSADTVNQKEDGCAAAVYWTGSEWCASVMLWEYVIHNIPLTDSMLTERQKKQNVRGVSGVIYGANSVSKAEWQKRARPTFKSRKANKDV